MGEARTARKLLDVEDAVRWACAELAKRKGPRSLGSAPARTPEDNPDFRLRQAVSREDALLVAREKP